MQEKAVVKVTLEHIPKEILISIMLLLNFKDMSNLSKTCKLWNKLFNDILGNKYFENQLADKWVEKIKAEITSEPPQYTDNKVFQYKDFYMSNRAEKAESNMWISAVRKVGAFFTGNNILDKIKFYSEKGFDIQLDRLLSNHPVAVKNLYNFYSYTKEQLQYAIRRGHNKIFDIHFKAFKTSNGDDIKTTINMVDYFNDTSLLHYAVHYANIYCVKVLLEHGGNPLVKTLSSRSTSYAIAFKLDSKNRDAVFDLLLAKTVGDSLKADLSNLDSDQFQEKYGVDKDIMLKKTQNQQQTSKNLAIDDAGERNEPSNLGLKK